MKAQRINKEIKEMIKHLGKVGILKNAARFQMELKLNISEKSKKAHAGYTAGRPQIWLGMGGRQWSEKAHDLVVNETRNSRQAVWKAFNEQAANGLKMFAEYHHYWKDPEIGSFTHDDLHQHQRALIAHELSHAVQYWNKYRDKDPKYCSTAYQAHGLVFRDIYRVLRKEFINPFIKPLVAMPTLAMRNTPTKKYNRDSPKGAVAIVFSICDSLFKVSGHAITKSMVIDQAREQGVNAGTASTQFYKWRKQNN